jgi:alpha-glucosidase
LELQGQRPLGSSVRIASATPSKIDETYHLVAGKASTVRNYCNALRIDLEETGDPGRKLVVEARVYDDAVAFRYLVPEQRAIPTFQLTSETTEFRASKDATAYALELPNFRTSYESEFIKLPISGIGSQGGNVAGKPLIGLPLLMNLPGVAWVGITEANLRGNSSMYLQPASNRSFQSRLAPQQENAALAVEGGLPHYSAWRVLLVGAEPGRLIESNVITSLNPESAIKDTSWIRPGRAAWNWWSGSIGADGKPAGVTTANMKYYVDFAAKSGFEHMLIDAGWNARGDITKCGDRIDIPEVVKYAAEKNVKVWIWLSYASINKEIDRAFPVYESWGVAGLKIDFISRDDQAGIDFYYHAVEKAAQHHLMLDFHGPTKPTGIERMWPNILGYEAVLGMEYSRMSARDNPDHHVMLPFSRMLAGTMDYTPGGFDNVTREEFVIRGQAPMVMGTRAHHLAMYAVYYCPIQMVSDWPGAYENQPSFQFIKDAPATWDETRVLGGEPGEYVTIARRHGRDWFLGSMTNWTPRQIEIPLAFLGAGKFTAQIYADAADAAVHPKNVSITTQAVDRSMHLKPQLAPGGGYAVRFIPR